MASPFLAVKAMCSWSITHMRLQHSLLGLHATCCRNDATASWYVHLHGFWGQVQSLLHSIYGRILRTSRGHSLKRVKWTKVIQSYSSCTDPPKVVACCQSVRLAGTGPYTVKMTPMWCVLWDCTSAVSRRILAREHVLFLEFMVCSMCKHTELLLAGSVVHTVEAARRVMGGKSRSTA